jgi:hypothetical protein
VTGICGILAAYLLADAILTNARVPSHRWNWTHLVSLGLACVLGGCAWWLR